MRKISMFAAALILIAVGAWTITTTPRVVAKWNVKTINEPAMSGGVDTFGLMVNAKDLPQENWQFRAPVAREGTR